MLKFKSLLFLAILINGCAAYQLDTAQHKVRTSFAAGDYQTTAELIKKLDKKNVYQKKDRVLLNLEQGMINHFAHNYEESSRYFSQAELQIDELFTKSVSRAIKSFVVNDNSLAYDGEDYEDIYLNIFKSLNYIHQNKLESALVETRRVTYKLERLEQKYNGLVESLAKADTTGTSQNKWKTGSTSVENSALGRYLSTILFAKTGKPDDARIEYEQFLKAYHNQKPGAGLTQQSEHHFQQLTQANSYNILLQAFSGRAPIKEQQDIRLYLAEIDSYLKISLPTLLTFHTAVSSITVTINDAEIIGLHLIEEMDWVAKEVYKVKEPIIYARAIVRGVLKAIAAKKLEKTAAKESSTLGIVANIVGKVAQEATEKADLRSWQTMPGKAYARVIKLPPGRHKLSFNYYGHNRNLLFTEERQIEVSKNETLKLAESIYWN